MSSFIQTSPNEFKILGVSWNKLSNNLSISMPKFHQTVTKKVFYAKRPQYMIHEELYPLVMQKLVKQIFEIGERRIKL